MNAFPAASVRGSSCSNRLISAGVNINRPTYSLRFAINSRIIICCLTKCTAIQKYHYDSGN